MKVALALYVDAYWISPYAFSAFVALREKSIPFEARELNLAARDHQAPGYQTASLTGRVPALEVTFGDGRPDFWLSESSAIVEYLEDRFPEPPLLPRDLEQRARARQIMAWIRSDLLPIREERPTTTMFYERAQRPLSPTAEAAVARLLRVTEQLITPGAGSLFDDFSIADADLAFMLQRLIMNQHEVPATTRAFAEAVWARPAAQEWANRKRIPFAPY